MGIVYLILDDLLVVLQMTMVYVVDQDHLDAAGFLLIANGKLLLVGVVKKNK